MKDKLYLHVPSFEELDYRQGILSQPDTMAYNRGYELKLENYNNETGCINFRREYWKDWFSRWINNTPEKYYAYIMKADENIPIGEVALRYDNERKSYCVNIIIEAQYRGNGYSEQALKLLMDVAFYELGAKEVYDDFPQSRLSAEKIFKEVGFKRISDDIVVLSKRDYLNLFNPGK